MNWSLALKNLKRNRRRNLATGSAIALGFAALLALGGYIMRVENYLRVYTIYGTRAGHIVIYKKNGIERYSIRPRDYSLSKDDQAKIEAALAQTPGIELKAPTLLGAGLIGNGCRTLPFIATGIDPQVDKQVREHPEMQKWAKNIKDVSAGKGLWNYPEELGAVALSEGLARLLGKSKVHDDFPPDAKPVVVVDCLAPDAKDKIAGDANVQLVSGSWSGMMAANDGEVVAQYSTGVTETNHAALMASLKYLQKLYDTENVTYYSIWLSDPRTLSRTMLDLGARLRAAGGDFDVYRWDDEKIGPFYTGTMQFLRTMIGFICFVLATVIIFSIFNSATMTVIERSQEIGMLRSVGFTQGYVRSLFVREMMALTAISVVAGALVATIGIGAINAADIRFQPPGIAGGMQLILTPNAVVVVAAAALIFALAGVSVFVALRSIVKQKITVLLMGSHR
jgi:putative ABC transport system permease protein